MRWRLTPQIRPSVGPGQNISNEAGYRRGLVQHGARIFISWMHRSKSTEVSGCEFLAFYMKKFMQHETILKSHWRDEKIMHIHWSPDSTNNAVLHKWNEYTGINWNKITAMSCLHWKCFGSVHQLWYLLGMFCRTAITMTSLQIFSISQKV